MKVTELNIELEFVEPILGSSAGNPDVHRDWIAKNALSAKAAEEEVACIPKNQGEEPAVVEAANIEEVEAKAATVFPRDENGLFLWDYQIRGHLKESIGMLIELGHPAVEGLSKYAHKKAVNHLILVKPRRAYLINPGGTPWIQAPKRLQRPLRGETLRGERIALATSEELPAGTTCQFTIGVVTGSNTKSKLDCFTEDSIRAALEYGKDRGIGQWRSGGFGRYAWREVVVKQAAA